MAKPLDIRWDDEVPPTCPWCGCVFTPQDSGLIEVTEQGLCLHGSCAEDAALDSSD